MKPELHIEAKVTQTSDGLWSVEMETRWSGLNFPTEKWEQGGFTERKYAEDFAKETALKISSSLGSQL